ncbi:MAG: UDP-N-acetylmuramoyl-tripeptide--D-alanyl-D-alanine ligase [Gammaproteobacteria bacterium]|nr:UDP-N-acetylmuramoyl-tripeptide--D-alanyl-D-alanine ligase [Gammaproteobacteria bacterium]
MTEGIATTLATVSRWLEARLLGPDLPFSGVTTDSRQVTPGSLFIALRGPHHDGHHHVAAAAEAGAVAALVEQPVACVIPQILVADSRLALGALAGAWRRELATPLVAVTGSNGKTTVKEMCAAILGTTGATLATRGNLNNEIGVPLTLLRLQKEHRFGVIEMGANHPGEIAYLTRITAPQVAILNNAAAAHLEGFGSLEGVARAKAEIFEGLGANGVAVINGDDPFAPLWRGLVASHQVLSFGLQPGADVTAQWQGDLYGSRLEVTTPVAGFRLDLALPGRHNVLNALAAIAAATALNIDSQHIVAGLESMRGVGGRLQARRGRHGATVIDDSYNANPDSIRAGLMVLGECAGQRYLALGEMAELGEGAAALHRQVGETAREAGIDRLYACGPLSRDAVEAFGEHGYFFAQQQQLIEALLPQMRDDVTVLVKGSRSSHMERVVEALCAGGEG